MSEVDELGSDDHYALGSAAARYRCEDCGYKWQVRGFNEETDEEESTVYTDGNTDLEPTTCPLCGCSDILPL